MAELKPLRDIPLEIDVDGVRVIGVIRSVVPNDITVEILSHGAGRRNGTHVAAFAMYPVNWLALYERKQTTAITPRGQQRAESLLRELYENPRLTEERGMRALRQ